MSGLRTCWSTPRGGTCGGALTWSFSASLATWHSHCKRCSATRIASTAEARELSTPRPDADFETWAARADVHTDGGGVEWGQVKVLVRARSKFRAQADVHAWAVGEGLRIASPITAVLARNLDDSQRAVCRDLTGGAQ